MEIDGEQRFVLSKSELSKAEDDFHFSLVLKFSRSGPSLDVIHMTVIKTWGLQDISMINVMADRHVLVHMKTERDFVHGWAREGRSINGCVFCIFWWTKDFDVNKESSLAPQWIFLGLSLHMYHTDCLQILATKFGRLLGIDNATINRTRASGAWICVEVDLNEELVQDFPIIISNSMKIW